MLSLKSLVIASSIVTFFSGASAGVVNSYDLVKRNSPPILPSCSNYTAYKYAGFFADQSTPTTSLIWHTNLNSQNMTVEICTAYCKGNDYQYAGLEYYGECFCGASVNSVQVDESFCTYPCTGDATETCGGTDYLFVYQDPTYPAENYSTIADYNPLGCYTDLTSQGRTLEWQQNQLITTNMTVEECLFTCKDGGYALAGVEYGLRCFCGVVLGNGTSQVDYSQCSTPCTGNANEICGGPSLLNLYVATDIESTQPCSGGSPPISSSTSSPTPTPTPSSTSSSTPPPNPTTPKSTTMNSISTTTTKPSLCTSTTTVSPTLDCERSCGNWCSKPIPAFTDAKSCSTAASACAVQVASCFLNAGFPASLRCLDFAAWCSNIGSFGNNYCPGTSCSVSGCKSKYPPNGPTVTPTVSTTVYTCSAAATSSTKTSSSTTSTSCVPVPTPSNICSQPNSPSKGYTFSSPVGGIALPCLICNNLYSDYNSGNLFKLYTNADTTKCNSFDSRGCNQGCKDACDSQYSSCMNTYAQSCKGNSGSGGQDTYSSATAKCKNQYSDCYATNSGVSGGSRCSSWNSGWK